MRIFFILCSSLLFYDAEATIDKRDPQSSLRQRKNVSDEQINTCLTNWTTMKRNTKDSWVSTRVDIPSPSNPTSPATLVFTNREKLISELQKYMKTEKKSFYYANNIETVVLKELQAFNDRKFVLFKVAKGIYGIPEKFHEGLWKMLQKEQQENPSSE